MLRKSFFGLSLIGILGCHYFAPRDSTKPRQGIEMSYYSGENAEYNITATEEDINGFCIRKTVTIKEKPAGLNNHPYHVTRAIGWDTGCNNLIDDGWFVSTSGLSPLNGYLRDYLLSAFDIAKTNTGLKHMKSRNEEKIQ